jgi:hypothetical protein
LSCALTVKAASNINTLIIFIMCNFVITKIGYFSSI